MSKQEKNALDSNTDTIRNIQEELLASANDALKEKIDWVKNWYSQDAKHSIMSRWELGTKVAEVIADREKGGGKKYGIKGLETIAAFSGEAAQSLRICARMATLYTRAQMLEISEMVMADGVTPLAFSHMRAVVSVKDAEKRQQVLNQALENCWTSVQLSTHVNNINAEAAGKVPMRKGRPLAKPQSLNAVITQQQQFADDFEKRNEAVWRDPDCSIQGRFKKLTEEEVSDETVESLGRVAYQMRKVAEQAAQRADEAAKCHEEAREMLQRKNTKKRKVFAVDKLSKEDLDDNEEVDKKPARRYTRLES